LIGAAGADTLNGFGGTDTLDGGTGADTMIGGIASDTYIVDNIGDVVSENASEGNDLVQSLVTYSLSANVENLTLTGTGAIDATGNSLDNTLTGNNWANLLIGGQGDDTLNGGAGGDTLNGGVGIDVMRGDLASDTYIVDNASDTVVESASEGNDTVQASVTFSLSANVENLTLTGNGAIDATGNSLDNTIAGNVSANILIGGQGADTLDGAGGGDTLNGGVGADVMRGGLASDTYIVDNVSDTVTEAASEGNDTVQASVTFTLGANVENLTLTGSDSINGIGNTLNNDIVGNSADNTVNCGAGTDSVSGGGGADTINGGDDADILQGGQGADTLSGGTGNDQLQGGAANDDLMGGAGADIFIFGDDNSNDTVEDFQENSGDKIDLSAITEITGFSDLVNHHLNDPPLGGRFNTILFGTSGTIYLVDTDIPNLSENDFIFA
jgi:trimeric autotransporter adhesin